MDPEVAAHCHCETGEGPLWNPFDRRLYWTDIPAGCMYRLDPATGSHECFYRGRSVGGFTIQQNGSLLLFMDRGTVGIWRDGQLQTVVEELPGEEESRFNDVIADPAGRVFCGTMPAGDRPGRLYCLETDGSIRSVVDEVGLPNGMGFTEDRRTLYFTDSRARTIWAFDYDEGSGRLSGRRAFAVVDEPGQVVPDGLTLDSEGYVWSAWYGGAAIVRYDPEGRIDRKVDLPTLKITSLTFAGEARDVAYVTSAGGAEGDPSLAGALFRLSLGVHGRPEFLSAVKLEAASPGGAASPSGMPKVGRPVT
jgi:D-xylono/L-arabinono-1,4-lactonase